MFDARQRGAFAALERQHGLGVHGLLREREVRGVRERKRVQREHGRAEPGDAARERGAPFAGGGATSRTEALLSTLFRNGVKPSGRSESAFWSYGRSFRWYRVLPQILVRPDALEPAPTDARRTAAETARSTACSSLEVSSCFFFFFFQ